MENFCIIHRGKDKIMIIHEVKGDILHQDVEVIVNSWNMNIIPWWLLIPQGVSGAIKKYGGNMPFKELAKCGWMALGDAKLTNAGNLKYKGIIHVAGINMIWIATEYSIRKSVNNAMKIVNDNDIKSVAFPLIGSGSGNRSKKWSKAIILDEFKKINSEAKIVIVEYEKSV
jgi:O-acetyl-ADP-ribose deacetylase